ncbi:MAG: phosphodiester glycosidase family protein, partial [Chthoniobacterales bacterium]
LGYCDDATLAGLAEILATAQLSDGFTVWRAMNLDGGSSSAFCFRRADGTAFAIPESKRVRDFLGVVAK